MDWNYISIYNVNEDISNRTYCPVAASYFFLFSKAGIVLFITLLLGFLFFSLFQNLVQGTHIHIALFR